MPNFFVVGAGKSGTTSIYEYLSEHPEIFMSPVKETNFFALKDRDLPAEENDPLQMNHYPDSITNWDDYKGLFTGASSYHKAIGEVSPMYLYSPIAALNIRQHVPDAKIIAILRQPSDRLYSRYMHLMREDRAPSQNLEEIFNEDSIWWHRNDLVREGFYHKHLKWYLDLFCRNQLMIVLYDDLVKDPLNLMSRIYTFLGVNKDFVPSLDKKLNPSGIVVNRNLDVLIGQKSIIKNMVKKIAPDFFARVAKNGKIINKVNEMRAKNLHKPPLATELKNRITTEVYGHDIANLQNVLNRDLSTWMPKKEIENDII